jgi:hypothetical protein
MSALPVGTNLVRLDHDLSVIGFLGIRLQDLHCFQRCVVQQVLLRRALDAALVFDETALFLG